MHSTDVMSPKKTLTNRSGFDLKKEKKNMHNSSFLVQRGSVLRHKSAPVIPILTRSKSSVVKLLSTSHFHTNNVE